MIEHLDGTLLKRSDSTLIIDVGGVGYGVEVSEPHSKMFSAEGEPAKLWIFTKVREDEIKLFGFPTSRSVRPSRFCCRLAESVQKRP